MKYILSLICGMCLLAQSVYAGNYSYVYIEGDKQTPFYVKLEGQMQPRLGKNYCIIPNLAAGVSYIEILFQQNAYPPQKFAINVPESGSRGFVLQKVNDRQFALYDIQQKNYIVSGNKPEEDHIPEPEQQQAPPVASNTAPAAEVPIAATAPVAASGDGEIPAFRPEKKKTKAKPAKTEEADVAQEPKKDNRFLDNVELNSDGTAVGSAPAVAVSDPLPPVPKPAKTKKKAPKKEVKTDEGDLAAITDETDFPEHSKASKAEANDPGVPNSDCKTAMSSDDFENFALKILDKSDDDARIKVLSKSKGRLCFTTEQVRIIANNLDTQSGRFDVVKMLYAQTSDQSNYPRLESLFKTSFLKEKFRQIINPK
ncbi:DUF4476 domain-containing protein [Taibaiella koreensis]|uniref:DUF4476 domain-containing protein n=1 Tax=Taibaiella koreensis TaxID=1268548 RepID=UPI000E59E138|nr:DUF4476 domain-containing protein [Taibaiella koreensis]